MDTQCCDCVIRACRLKSATWREQGRNHSPVNFDQKNQRSCCETEFMIFSVPVRFSACSRALFTAGILTFRMLLLGMITRLHGERFSAPMSRRDSLTNRLARFRFTALMSNFLLHIIPHRRKSSVSGIHNIVKRPDDSRRPICFTLSNSLRQRRLSNAFTGIALPAVYAQRARRLRPFARRRFRTRRPPAVFILFLNPQVRRRLILEC